MSINPSLFGLKKSNRDFTTHESWGKNQFNSSFPASLCCYMYSKGLDAIYLSNNKGQHTIGRLPITKLFGIAPDSEHIFFSFESAYIPFQPYLTGSLPRTDLVIQDLSKRDSAPTGFLEIKLTALPDNSTHNLSEPEYGSELVVRPDTIVYQAASIAKNNLLLLKSLATPQIIGIKDWSQPYAVVPHLDEMCALLRGITSNQNAKETPLMLQPVWKTQGKSPVLADNCLDVFVWSDLALTNFICDIANTEQDDTRITRQTRTVIWLFKMLLEISQNGRVSHHKVIDELTYNTKNDKAFASNGNVTTRYMSSPELTKPRITKAEIKNIILGNGQNLLSPERRFDAIIYSSPELFK